MGGTLHAPSTVESKVIFLDGLTGGNRGDADVEILRSRGATRIGEGIFGLVFTGGRHVGSWNDLTSRPNPGSTRT